MDCLGNWSRIEGAELRIKLPIPDGSWLFRLHRQNFTILSCYTKFSDAFLTLLLPQYQCPYFKKKLKTSLCSEVSRTSQNSKKVVGGKGREKSLLTGKLVVCFSSPRFVTLWTCNLWNSVQLETPINYQFWRHPTDFWHSDILIKRIQSQVSFTGSLRQLGKLFWLWSCLPLVSWVENVSPQEVATSGIVIKSYTAHTTWVAKITITMRLPECVHLSHGFKKGIFDKQQFPSIMHSEMEILLARCKDP